MKTKEFLQKTIDFGIIGILLLFPLSISISFNSYADIGHPLFSVNLSLADLIIGIVFLIWMVKILLYKEWTLVKAPPLPIVLYFAIALLSLLNAAVISQWLKEVIQIGEYFILLYMLIINNLKSVKKVDLFNALFGVTTINLLIAACQHLIFENDSFLVRGLFPNQNILSTFLCFVIPVAYANLLRSKRWPRKLWMIAMILLGYFVLMSGSALLSILISLIIISILNSIKTLLRFSIIMVFLISTYGIFMPDNNIKAVSNFLSFHERGSINNNYYARLAMLHTKKTKLLKKDFGNKYLLITTDIVLGRGTLNISKGTMYKDIENQVHIKNRYLEMQSAINMISNNALLGVGLGNYQNNIGMNFKELPKLNTAEPNQHNGYFIIASTMGLLGLTALIWILCACVKMNYQKYRIDKVNNVIYLGLVGSIVAIGIENLFSYLFFSSLLVPFIFFIYFSLEDYHDKN